MWHWDLPQHWWGKIAEPLDEAKITESLDEEDEEWTHKLSYPIKLKASKDKVVIKLKILILMGLHINLEIDTAHGAASEWDVKL